MCPAGIFEGPDPGKLAF